MENSKFVREMIEGRIPAYEILYTFVLKICGMPWSCFVDSGGPTMYSSWKGWYKKLNVPFPYKEEQFGFLVKRIGFLSKSYVFSYPEPEKAGNRIADVVIADSIHNQVAILGILAKDEKNCTLWGRDEKGYYYLINTGTREEIFHFISRKHRFIMRLIGTDWAYRQQHVLFY